MLRPAPVVRQGSCVKTVKSSGAWGISTRPRAIAEDPVPIDSCQMRESATERKISNTAEQGKTQCPDRKVNRPHQERPARYGRPPLLPTCLHCPTARHGVMPPCSTRRTNELSGASRPPRSLAPGRYPFGTDSCPGAGAGAGAGRDARLWILPKPRMGSWRAVEHPSGFAQSHST